MRADDQETRMNAKSAGAALAALALLAASPAIAGAHRHRRPVAPAYPYCLPANGAQVLGGYAAPTDLLDPVTGEICNPRRGWPPR